MIDTNCQITSKVLQYYLPKKNRQLNQTLHTVRYRLDRWVYQNPSFLSHWPLYIQCSRITCPSSRHWTCSLCVFIWHTHQIPCENCHRLSRKEQPAEFRRLQGLFVSTMPYRAFAFERTWLRGRILGIAEPRSFSAAKRASAAYRLAGLSRVFRTSRSPTRLCAETNRPYSPRFWTFDFIYKMKSIKLSPWTKVKLHEPVKRIWHEACDARAQQVKKWKWWMLRSGKDERQVQGKRYNIPI